MAELSIDQLKETRIVIEAKGVTNLAAYADLRLLDSELEQGVQALYSDASEAIVAFVFSKGAYTEETAREWVTQAEKNGVNLAVRAGLQRKPPRPSFVLAGGSPVTAVAAELSFTDVRDLLAETLEDSQVTMPDGSYRYPWLIDVFVDYCIIMLASRYYRVPYTIDESNTVTFGETVEVTRAWEPVAQPDDGTALAADLRGTPRVFNLSLRDPVALPADIAADGEGLIWKEIFRVSTTFRPGTGAPLVVESSMLDAMLSAFEARVLNNVAITDTTHHEETDGIVPAAETVGFVEKLVKAGESLFAGLDVRDAEARSQLDQGLIRDCSVYVWGDFHDRSQPDMVWPWVLVHLLLTNYPQLPDLQGFGVAPEAVAASFSGVQFTQYREEPMPEEPRTQTPALSPEDAALLDQARQLRAAGFALDGALERQAQLRKKARGLEVDSIVAALEGRSQREDVTTIEGTRHYPAVVQAAAEALRPEQVGFDIADDGTSPVDAIVLGIVNALPKEARFALNASARPNRTMAGASEPGQEARHRTTPIAPEVARELPEDAIERFDKALGG